MSDAVMVPREAKRQLIVDLDAAPFTREFFDALNGYATGGSGRCLDTLSIWNAWLAASPSVGGWDREICTGCTSSLSIADIKARGVVSCCPDRHMVRIGDLVDAYTARPPRILPQTEKGL